MIKITEINTEGETKTIERTYDCMNRVATYTDCNGKIVKYGYDELGNIVSLTYAGGEIVRYSYTDNGLLEAVVDGEGYKTSYTYDGSGRLLTNENPDGTVETNTYDGYGRLASTTLEVAGEELYTISYTYDQWGNILTISCEGEGAEDAGISTLTPATMTYDESNRMLTYNGEDIIYDEDGNMTYGPLDGEMTTFEYDCRNRLIRAGDTTYEYDAEDVRIAVETPEYRDKYVTDTVTALSRVLEVDRTYKDVYNQNHDDQSTETQATTRASGDTVKSVYYYGNGLIYEKNSEDGLLVYHYDHLGSTKAVTDDDGNIIAKFSYGTYGELLTDKTEYSTTVSEIRFLYNGELGVITDDNSLYYMRTRYYNPQIKRFINQDILTGNIGNNKSLNRYSYVEGNPVSYTDPFGLSPVHFILDVAGIFFPPADLLNAGLYLLEGNYKEAAKSVIYSIPGSDVAGFLGKFTKTGTKASKYVDAIAGGISTGGNALAMLVGAEDLGNGIAGLIEKYGVQGEKFSAETIAETGLIVLSAAQLGSGVYHYNKGIKSSDAPNTEKLSAGNTDLPDADDLILNQASGKAGYDGGSKPIGATFEGTIYRSVDSRYNPLEMSQYTIDSNHRYTERGVPGLYFSSGEKIVRAELGNYDIFDFSNRTMYSYDVKLTNMLDVSNPSVRSQLGLSLDSLVENGYDVTHAVGRYAYSSGYNGIIAPSARADGGINIILFNVKGMK